MLLVYNPDPHQLPSKVKYALLVTAQITLAQQSTVINFRNDMSKCIALAQEPMRTPFLIKGLYSG